MCKYLRTWAYISKKTFIKIHTWFCPKYLLMYCSQSQSLTDYAGAVLGFSCRKTKYFDRLCLVECITFWICILQIKMGKFKNLVKIPNPTIESILKFFMGIRSSQQTSKFHSMKMQIPSAITHTQNRFSLFVNIDIDTSTVYSYLILMENE